MTILVLIAALSLEAAWQARPERRRGIARVWLLGRAGSVRRAE
jgi:hypothetical protein